LILGRRTGKGRAHPVSPCGTPSVSIQSFVLVREPKFLYAVSQRQASRSLLCGRAGAQIADNGRNGRTSHVQRDETSTGASLVIEANSWRSARGGSSPLQIVDEICAMRGIDSALSDEELLTAKRPTLATMSGCFVASKSDGQVWLGYDACMQYGDNHDKSIMVVRNQRWSCILGADRPCRGSRP